MVKLTSKINETPASKQRSRLAFHIHSTIMVSLVHSSRLHQAATSSQFIVMHSKFPHLNIFPHGTTKLAGPVYCWYTVAPDSMIGKSALLQTLEAARPSL